VGYPWIPYRSSNVSLAGFELDISIDTSINPLFNAQKPNIHNNHLSKRMSIPWGATRTVAAPRTLTRNGHSKVNITWTVVPSSPLQAASSFYLLSPWDLKNRVSWMIVSNETLLMRTASDNHKPCIGNKTRNYLKGLLARPHNRYQNHRFHSHRPIFFEEKPLLDPKLYPPYNNFYKHFMSQKGFED